MPLRGPCKGAPYQRSGYMSCTMKRGACRVAHAGLPMQGGPCSALWYGAAAWPTGCPSLASPDMPLATPEVPLFVSLAARRAFVCAAPSLPPTAHAAHCVAESARAAIPRGHAPALAHAARHRGPSARGEIFHRTGPLTTHRAACDSRCGARAAAFRIRRWLAAPLAPPAARLLRQALTPCPWPPR
eukprot:359335-Chlamydomonas_euryale.AAC.2